MPSAPDGSGITETWFCPGVPATGVDDVEGSITIANWAEERMVGTILLNDQRQSLRVTVDGWSSATVDLDETLPGRMVGAVIEVDGGGAIVEQQSLHPSGKGLTACANATSDTRYLADGFTVDGSLDQVVLTNLHEQTVANLEFATREGSRVADLLSRPHRPAAECAGDRPRCASRCPESRSSTVRVDTRVASSSAVPAFPRRRPTRHRGEPGVTGAALIGGGSPTVPRAGHRRTVLDLQPDRRRRRGRRVVPRHHQPGLRRPPDRGSGP